MKVFVAGLSRSGKTSRSQHAASELLDIDYVSISQLLQAAEGVFPVQTLADGLANQRRAADALRAMPATRRHQLIDGHALIETGEGPLLVPDWFFDEVAPNLILYVYDRPEEILSRRSPISSRNLAAEITALSTIERAACERMATRLKIRLISLDAPSVEEFTGELRQHLEQAQ
jgi:adenylate kinase